MADTSKASSKMEWTEEHDLLLMGDDDGQWPFSIQKGEVRIMV